MIATQGTDKIAELYEATQQVVGQERARRNLSTLFDRQWAVAQGDLEATNGALICGWSGSGKTYLTRMMSQALGLPFAETNATRYTEQGYSGLNLEQMFLPLLNSAALMYDAEHPQHSKKSVLERPDKEMLEIIALAEKGVVFLDEFDKWMQRINHVTGRQETAIQGDLLKMVEGSVEFVNDVEDGVGVPFNTAKVLIVCGGAFVGLSDQVRRRLDRDSEDVVKEEFWEMIEPDDFVRFGIIPELIGRLSTQIFLKPLGANDLTKIMLREGGVAHEYRLRFEKRGITWDVSEEGLNSISRMAHDRMTGARALEHIMHTVFAEALFYSALVDGPMRVIFDVNQHKAQLVGA